MGTDSTDLDARRIGAFLAVAFGLAWAVAAVVFLTGGIGPDAPELVPGIPLWLVLVSTGYMFAPAVANVVTRVATGEGWRELWVRPRIREGWPAWLAGWLAPAALTLLGVGLFYALFPAFFDSSLGAVEELLAGTGVTVAEFPGGAAGFAAVQLLQALLLGAVVNGAFTFGEEFGWRGYLLQKLLPLGWRRATVVLGVVWGVWHWPILAMGYNYGLDYPYAPWPGMLAMVWFTFVVGVVLAWVTLRGRSVWPAVLGHATVNAVGGYGSLFVQGEPSPLLGPNAVGLVVMVPWTVVALYLLWRPGRLPGVEGTEPTGESASGAPT